MRVSTVSRMDNLTHSIAGLLLAEAVNQWKARGGEASSRSFVNSVRVVSILGNNLPDIDFLYAGITEGKLGYLLHHRGHTHTLIGAIGGSLLVFALALIVRRLLRSPSLPGEMAWIAGVCWAAPLMHLAMDFSNNYGVHPFWPFDNRWVYGDAVFIVEPWFWAVAVPCLVLATRSWLMRGALGLVLLSGLGLAWTVAFVPWGVALALTLGAVTSSAIALRLGAWRRVLFACVAWVSIELGFAAASHVALARAVRAGGPHVLDAVMTPAPANPLCFNAIVIVVEHGVYRLRLATVATFPELLSVHHCRAPGTTPDLPMALSDRSLTNSSDVSWIAEWSGSVQELANLNRTHCQVSAFLRFARAPYWYPSDQGGLRIGDLRYDRDPGLGFAELELALDPENCPEWVPAWEPPRKDML